jgi:opacity protein-like surface antigen
MVVALAMAAVTNTYAMDEGLYMGLMFGPSTNSADTVQAQVEDEPFTTTATPKKNQFGTRVYLGYQTNKFFAVEGGLTYFSQIGYSTNGVDTCSGSHAQVSTFDILGKGILPLGKLGIYGKAGVIVSYTQSTGDLNPDLTSTCGKSDHSVNARPGFGAGISYDLSQNWVADVSWNRFMVGGVVNSIDYYALGFSYHFVDKYCGQFLCDD